MKQMNPGLKILAYILGFLFSFLCVQIGGVTDQTPLTAASKASQLVFGAATLGHGYTIAHAQMLNLIARGIASGAADVATSLNGDFPYWIPAAHPTDQTMVRSGYRNFHLRLDGARHVCALHLGISLHHPSRRL